jgi:lipopolysaccharide transport system permease protein
VFNFFILLVALAVTGFLHISILLFPLLLVPIVLFSIGLAWFLSAWGVFIKDMTQIVPVFVQMLMFLSPVFYPVSALPQQLQPIYLHNPLGAVIEACHAVITGNPIPWVAWGLALLLSVIAFVLGYAFFQHSREEFADVL